jgi:hypothetical protein
MILCPAMSNVSRPFWWFMCVFLSCFMMKLDETCYRRYLSWADANRIRTRLTNAFHVPWWSWNLQIHVKYIYIWINLCASQFTWLFHIVSIAVVDILKIWRKNLWLMRVPRHGLHGESLERSWPWATTHRFWRHGIGYEEHWTHPGLFC